MNLIKMKKIVPFLIVVFIYILIHFFTMQKISRIDIFYLFFLVIVFATTAITLFIRSESMKILSINFALLTSFILILELCFFIGIFKHVAISPITFKLNNIQRSNVDALDLSPWYKFSSQSQITSIGERGDDFEYSWTTDFLGYKNLDSSNKKNNYKFLALGDSFTEGMGVSIENTWTNIISTKYDTSVYNAGVQGYSASQFFGTLIYLQDKIKFDGIIIGHLPTIYQREINYASRPDKATGGIESIRVNKLNKGLALPQILKGSGSYIKTILKKDNHSYAANENDKFAKYIIEIVKPEDIDTKFRLKENDYWMALVKSYRQIAEFCILNNKKLVLVAFPMRYEVYFPHNTRGLQSHLEDQYYVEYELLKEELSGLGIQFVDSYPALKSYSKDALDHELPYLIKDGHLSKYGNDIVAELISSSL